VLLLLPPVPLAAVRTVSLIITADNQLPLPPPPPLLLLLPRGLLVTLAAAAVAG
jgi:hypothetical protein